MIHYNLNNFFLLSLGKLFLGLCSLSSFGSDLNNSSLIKQYMQEVKAENELVGLGVAIADSHRNSAVFVMGKRKVDGNEFIQRDDAWHIGSNTKALTALLFSRLVEEGVVRWEQPIPSFFKDHQDRIDAAWEQQTILDLFSHRSGLERLGPTWILPTRLSDKPVIELRDEDVQDFLFEPPAKKVGKWKYSNLNYIIAGAAIEAALKEKHKAAISWEEAMLKYVFSQSPVSKAKQGWGFGPPKHIEGHQNSFLGFGSLNSVGKGSWADNPASLGPAGTIHVPLESHALLLTEFLQKDSNFLPDSQKKRLLSAYPDNYSDYALGWQVNEAPKLGQYYSHNGSNNMWLSYVIMAPEIDRIIIVNTNSSSNKILKSLKKFALKLANPKFYFEGKLNPVGNLLTTDN